MILSLLLLVGCSTVTPGNIVLAVSATAPEDERYSVIRGGRYWSGPNTDYYTIPTTEQRGSWSRDPVERHPSDESITFAGLDGQPVNVDIGVSFVIQNDDTSIIRLAKLYGPEINNVVNSRVRDSTRDALNRCALIYPVEEIYGEKKGELMDCALDKVRSEYDPSGLMITRLTLNSEVRLPPTVKEAMEARITASAKAEQTRREVETIRAEGEKSVAAATSEAEALKLRTASQAEADRLRAASITPETLRLKELEIQSAYISKWDGKLPNVMSEALPFFDFKTE